MLHCIAWEFSLGRRLESPETPQDRFKWEKGHAWVQCCCLLLSEVAVSECPQCFLGCEVLGLFANSGTRGRIHPAAAEGTKKVLSRRPRFIDCPVFQWTRLMCREVVVLPSDDSDCWLEDRKQLGWRNRDSDGDRWLEDREQLGWRNRASEGFMEVDEQSFLPLG